jgi:hypothetical protein
MPKIKKDFRLDPNVIKKIETLSDFFTQHSPTGSIPGQPTKITKTDIVEFAINKYYEDLQKEGYSLNN